MGAFRHLDTLLARYPALEGCREDIVQAYELLAASYAAGGKLLVCGNGGSAADSEHIVGELMKGFCLPRPLSPASVEALRAVDEGLGSFLAEHLQAGLPALALTGQTALSTAFQNDVVPELAFAQQAFGYGQAGDVLLGISTSGNSRNVLFAAITARAKGLRVIGLTGAAESRLAQFSDVCIRVPETETFKVQELHLPVYHCLCLMLEERYFGEGV